MTILQSLDRYYDRMAARQEVVEPGYSTEPIGFVLVLAADGSLVAVDAHLDPTGKRPRPERVPKWFGRSGTGSTPFFLWENTAYALGVSGKDPVKTARDHGAFRQLHLDELAAEDDAGLKALRLFIEHWTPDQFVPPKFDVKLLTLNLAFRLDGETRLIHERPAARPLIEKLRASRSSGTIGFCLVTGIRAPLVALHPKIKGVEGTASAEVPLVSFNKPAFRSHGKEQGDNAPTSEAAAFRYGAALNRMLQSGSRNRIQRTVGDTSIVFWADASNVGERAAEAAENWYKELFDPAGERDPQHDIQAAAKLRRKLTMFAEARPIKEIDPQLEGETQFCVLGLAPSTGRIAVRYWITDNFSNLGRMLAWHYIDLSIEPLPWKAKPPSVQRLLLEAFLPQGTREPFKYIRKSLGHLAGELTRSVLTGVPYPRTLLAAAVIRLRAGDNPGTGWHAAVIKACVNRAIRFRLGSPDRTNADASILDRIRQEELPVALDSNYQNPAYHLGRLFAVLEAAQYAALGRVNAPIGDRYYAAASSTPARVFGPLLRGLKHHVSDAKKRKRGGWIEDKVGQIMLMLPPDLPRTLRLEDQGRFAVGYYHERATRKPADEDTTSETEGGNDE